MNVMLEQMKRGLIARAPWWNGQPPANLTWSWPRLLGLWILYELFLASMRALAVVLLVLLIRRTWWDGLPPLSYLPAVGMVLLIQQILPSRRTRPPAGHA